MKTRFLLVGLLLPLCIFAQDCNCASDFQWLKETFEKNDAGFAYALDRVGEKAYENHNNSFLEKVKDIKDSNGCVTTLREWLLFFRSGHLGIRELNPVAQEELGQAAILAQYKDSERLEVDVDAFTQYLSKKETIDYEGIWVSEPYKIGIKKIEDTYVGFIIEADGAYWTQGQVKLKINADGSCEYYMRDHSPQYFDRTELLDGAYFKAGFITLEREFPKVSAGEEVTRYFKTMSANKPYFEQLDENTTYIRIPTFQGNEKRTIDSVIFANKVALTSSPNFIIDIRNNGGGSDRSYSELLPLMYTNPIRTPAVLLYSTPLNNQRMLDFIEDPKYDFTDSEKKWARTSYEKLSKRLGEFVNVDSTDLEITTYPEILPNPKNVAILINENNGSTAEQFLLAAKQSRKVKLYGTTTQGVLDISNMYFVKSPCGDFELGYSLSKSLRIPAMAIDDKGIQPDYYMDPNIPSHNWIGFVQDYLNGME